MMKRACSPEHMDADTDRDDDGGYEAEEGQLQEEVKKLQRT